MRTFNQSREIKLNPKWFKVKIVSRRNPKDVDYAYTSGENKFFVKFDLQQSMGLQYFVSVKEIKYDDMILELDRGLANELH